MVRTATLNIRTGKGAKVLGEGKMVGLGMRVWYCTLELSLCEMGLIRGSK